MNYWDYEEVSDQSFTITPREHEHSTGYVPFTADTTLYTADSTEQTADQTVIGGGTVTVYQIEYNEDGYYDKFYADANGLLDGSFLELTATLDLNKDTFYYFRVFVKDADKPEIFRGKAFTYDVLPSKPLHFSMYDNNEID